MKKYIVVLLVTLLALTGCGGKKASDDTHLKLGIIGGDSLVWNHVIEEAKKEGITIEIVAFSDYPQVNAALHQKEIDFNAFQHQAYLNKENEELGYDIVAIGKTVIAPLAIYSKQLNSLNELKDGDKIAIPNDVTNGGRALQLLEAAGLIKLNKDVVIPSLKDVTENPHNYQILELGAANLPGALKDVAVAAINSGIAVDAGYSPADDSLFIEEVSLKDENPYINIIAVNAADKDKEVFKKILKIYHTDTVKDLIKQDSKGANIPVW